MLKHKVLWVALSIVLSMCWWWLSQSEPGQVQKKPKNDQNIDNETTQDPQKIRAYGADGLQPLAEESVDEESAEMPASEVPQLDEDIAEFKYKNLKRLMSTRIDSLDAYQLEMVVQQIIIELPEMVSMGQMHPLDATFVHTQAMARNHHELQAFEVEAINKNYMDLYPFPINSGLLDLH